jgi:hypothetical protein
MADSFSRKSIESTSLESIIRSLPDDEERLKILHTLTKSGGSMDVGPLAEQLAHNSGLTSDDVADLLVGSAKDGLLSFSEDTKSVSLTARGISTFKSRKRF